MLTSVMSVVAFPVGHRGTSNGTAEDVRRSEQAHQAEVASIAPSKHCHLGLREGLGGGLGGSEGAVPWFDR